MSDTWQPPPLALGGRLTLGSAWRYAKFLYALFFRGRRLVWLHLPQEQVAELKAMAAGALQSARPAVACWWWCC